MHGLQTVHGDTVGHKQDHQITSQSLWVLIDEMGISVQRPHGAEAEAKWRAALTHSESSQSVMVVLPEGGAGGSRDSVSLCRPRLVSQIKAQVESARAQNTAPIPHHP